MQERVLGAWRVQQSTEETKLWQAFQDIQNKLYTTGAEEVTKLRNVWGYSSCTPSQLEQHKEDIKAQLLVMYRKEMVEWLSSGLPQPFYLLEENGVIKVNKRSYLPNAAPSLNATVMPAQAEQMTQSMQHILKILSADTAAATAQVESQLKGIMYVLDAAIVSQVDTIVNAVFEALHLEEYHNIAKRNMWWAGIVTSSLYAAELGGFAGSVWLLVKSAEFAPQIRELAKRLDRFLRSWERDALQGQLSLILDQQAVYLAPGILLLIGMVVALGTTWLFIPAFQNAAQCSASSLDMNALEATKQHVANVQGVNLEQLVRDMSSKNTEELISLTSENATSNFVERCIMVREGMKRELAASIK